MILAETAFILQHTRLHTPPLLPEVQLYLAEAITPLWHMTEAELGAHGVPPPFWAFAWVGLLFRNRSLGLCSDPLVCR